MAQKLVDQLQAKNKQLEQELQHCQDLFNNLTQEKGLESHDERRAFMLKAQIYQLERQCMLLSQAQSSRALVLNEIENQLSMITQALQQMLSERNMGPTVMMERSKVMDMVGSLQKLKNSLYKQSVLEGADRLRIPSMMSGSNYASSKKSIECLDVCKGELEHINLKQVAHLEQELSSLYKRLSGFNCLLAVSIPQSHTNSDENGHAEKVLTPEPETYLMSPILKKIKETSDQCINDLTHCCSELVALSLLHPNAPWSAVKSSNFDQLRPEKILQSFPPVAQKNRQVQSSVGAICKAHSYIIHMHNLKLNAMELQLSFHKAKSGVQLEYLHDLSACITKTFTAAEEDMLRTVRDPVKVILESWRVLKENQSSENLKKFLSDVKQHENQLEIISKLQPTEDKSRTGTSYILSNFMKTLNVALNRVEAEYRHKFAQAEKCIAQCEHQTGPDL